MVSSGMSTGQQSEAHTRYRYSDFTDIKLLLLYYTLGTSTRLTLKDVEKELLEVTDYYSLGLQLNVPQEIMRHLEADYQSNCRRKSEVLKFWLGNAKEASWAVLGAAVERMGVHSLLAESLKIKQGMLEKI